MKHLSKLTWAFVALMTIFTACDNVKDDEVTDPGTETPGTPGTGDDDKTSTSTFEAPYTVAQLIAKNPTVKDEVIEEGAWVEGHIVGWVNTDKNPSVKTFEAPFNNDYNILVATAASASETDAVICIKVTTTLRSALGLNTNASNLGKAIKIHGNISFYNSLPSLIDVDGYWFTESNTGVMPPKKEDTNVDYITIADLRKMYTGTAATLTIEKKIKGVVISDKVGGNSTSLKAFVIASEDNTAGINIMLSENHTYNMGDVVEIVVTNATLTSYGEAIQLQVAKANVETKGTATVTPVATTIAEINSNYSSYESRLVTVVGTATGLSGATVWGNSKSHSNNTITKDGSTLTAFVSKYANFINETIPTEEKSFTGIVGRFNDTYQLVIRNSNDIK